MGLKLFTTYLAAGLPAPQLRRDAPMGGGPGWPGYAYVAATVRSLLPFMERAGLVRADEVDVDTLEERCAPRSSPRTASRSCRPSWAPGPVPDRPADRRLQLHPP
jgi:hypothetical protein